MFNYGWIKFAFEWKFLYLFVNLYSWLQAWILLSASLMTEIQFKALKRMWKNALHVRRLKYNETTDVNFINDSLIWNVNLHPDPSWFEQVEHGTFTAIKKFITLEILYGACSHCYIRVYKCKWNKCIRWWKK